MNYGREVSGSLEPYAMKVARTILRGGDDGNVVFLPDILHVPRGKTFQR
jgi:hypothetical protein